jgi:hypothetical protein
MDRESFLTSGVAALAVSRGGGVPAARAPTFTVLGVGRPGAPGFIPPWVLAHPLLGEVRRFDGSVAPQGWMFCQGQLLPIAAFPRLFAILGKSGGGNGKTVFALPRSRVYRSIIAVTGAFGLTPAAIAAMRRAPYERLGVWAPNLGGWGRPAFRTTATRPLDNKPSWWPGTVPTARQVSDQQRAMRTRLTPQMLTPHYRGAPRQVP